MSALPIWVKCCITTSSKRDKAMRDEDKLSLLQTALAIEAVVTLSVIQVACRRGPALCKRAQRLWEFGYVARAASAQKSEQAMLWVLNTYSRSHGPTLRDILSEKLDDLAALRAELVEIMSGAPPLSSR
jgi:hypothetical protein